MVEFIQFPWSLYVRVCFWFVYFSPASQAKKSKEFQEEKIRVLFVFSKETWVFILNFIYHLSSIPHTRTHTHKIHDKQKHSEIQECIHYSRISHVAYGLRICEMEMCWMLSNFNVFVFCCFRIWNVQYEFDA